ncbi:MAG: efflux RND transporter periplasmic adaptor subunit [Flavobacteriales bacterium]|nr:efflux RND transporter periplasmic adaptor subunit [Flavobacteriales bacterium]MBP9080264.1 efflux RND transporter periplasmic adaptor subunit [Flavobacteriales bacterium]
MMTLNFLPFPLILKISFGRPLREPMQVPLRFLPLLLALTLLSACGGQGGSAQDDHDHAAEAAHGAEVALTPEQIKAIGLVTGTMEKRGLTTSLRANGRLVLPPDKSAEVSVLFGGLVRNVSVREGQHVDKGQTLAELESLEFLQLQQDFLESSANGTALAADLKRQQDLHDERITATKTLERAQADLSVAKARQAATAAKLRLFGVDPASLAAENLRSSFALRAPIAGNVQHITVTTGQFAEPNQPLFSIVDNSGLHIDLNIFEQDVARVRTGQQVVFGHAGEPIGRHTATIFAVNKAFENDQQAVLVHAKLDDNGEELLAGMYVDALIMTDSSTAWSLPDAAVVNNGDEHYIFVEHEPNTFVQTAVRTGASELGYTEILPMQPVGPGARIVVKGAYYLLSELTKGSGEHSH